MVTVAMPAALATQAPNVDRTPTFEDEHARTAGPDPGVNFVPNHGQFAPEVLYAAQGAAYDLYITQDEAMLVVSETPEPAAPGPEDTPKEPEKLSTAAQPGADEIEQDVLRLDLVGMNTEDVRVKGQGLQASESNYLLGEDPEDWVTHVPHFEEVVVEDVYEGVDMVWYGQDGQIKYDFLAHEDANPGAIEMTIEGAEDLSIDDEGGLVAETTVRDLVQPAPFAYQRTEDGKVEVPAEFDLDGQTVTFDVGDYDEDKPLVIDPLIEYSTYLGGSGYDSPSSVATDGEGNLYVTGHTQSTDFPTEDPVQGDHAGDRDIFVSKFGPDGDLIHSTYLGGSDGEFPSGLDVGEDGSVTVFGQTESGDYPLENAYDDQQTGEPWDDDMVVTRVAPGGGSLDFSTYLGGSGSEFPAAGTVTPDGDALIVGRAGDNGMPTTDNAYQPDHAGGGDVTLASFEEDGEANFVTYFGGSGDDTAGYDGPLAVNDAGQIAIVGRTTSDDLPTKNAYQDQRASTGYDGDAFAVRFSDDGDLGLSTYLGGSAHDWGGSAALDEDGSVVVGGGAGSEDFPLKNAFDAEKTGGTYDYDLIVARLTSGGDALAFSTYLGGDADETGSQVAFEDGRTFLLGETTSDNLPLKNAFDEERVGDQWDDDLVVAGFGPSGEASFSSYLGGDNYEDPAGFATDEWGNAYVFSRTASSDGMPITGDALQAELGGGSDAAVAVVDEDGTMAFSSYWGGSGFEYPANLDADDHGRVYAAGSTLSGDFPTRDAYQDEPTESENVNEGFASRLRVFDLPTPPIEASGVPGPDANQTSLSWSAPAEDGGLPVQSYNVYRGTSAGSLSMVGSTPSTGFVDDGLAPGTTYHYQVTAVSPVGEGNATDTFTVTTWDVPGAPEDVSATPGSDPLTVDVNWSAPSETGGTPLTGYNVLRYDHVNENASKVAELPADRTSYTDADLVPGNRYDYTVRAVSSVGPGAGASDCAVPFPWVETGTAGLDCLSPLYDDPPSPPSGP